MFIWVRAKKKKAGVTKPEMNGISCENNKE